MPYAVRVNSKQDIFALPYAPGALYVTPDGSIYQREQSDDSTLNGFMDVLKKVGSIAAAAAPYVVNVIPGIGQVASAAILAGSAVGGGLLASSGAGGGLAKGTAAITAYGQQVNAALDAAIGQVNAQNAQQIASAAQQLAATLSDGSKVYQAKNGSDAAALAAAKSLAAQKVEQINAAAAAAIAAAQQAAAAAAAQQTTTPTPTANNGGTPTAANNSGGSSQPLNIAGFQVEQQTLFLAVGGLAAFFFLFRR